MKTDVSIVGAGPAGLMACIVSAKSGAKTTAIEANTTAGRKLLRTGRTRCNLTHTGSVTDFVKAYGPFGKFLRHSLCEFSGADLRRYFAQHNLETIAEEDGSVFPATGRASNVRRILLEDARRLSVRFLYGRKARSIEKDNNGFLLRANAERITAQTVIVATGGVTWPQTGSTGDGYRFAQAFGHIVIEPKPCLVPLITAENWPRKLERVGVGNVIITAKSGDSKVTTTGPMMFNKEVIEGPAVFDLSRVITNFLPNPSEVLKITVDLIPGLQAQELDRKIVSLCRKNPTRRLVSVLAELLPAPLMLSLCHQLNSSGTIPAGRLQKGLRTQIVEICKKLPLSIKTTGPLAKATVTRGGISTDEIYPQTMESKLCPGLFFAGEVINVDGPSGGFNLQIAFSTGHLAGKMAAQCAK